MAKQPVVLRIGYMDILLPDDTGVQTVMRTLSKGLLCMDQSSYAGTITLHTQSAVTVQVSTVPRGTRVVHAGEEDAGDGSPPRANGRRRLGVDQPLLDGPQETTR